MKCRLILLMLLALVSCRAPKIPNHGKGESSGGGTNKFERALGIPLPAGINQNYVAAISEWLGVPYKYGGSSRSGTDCSGLVQSIYLKVFNKVVDHNSLALFNKAKSISKGRLLEGDLLFFKINGNKISHVGMHVTDNYFIHASTKKGVVISSITEPYYQKTFSGYGTFR